jgi:hypothetical protein
MIKHFIKLTSVIIILIAFSAKAQNINKKFHQTTSYFNNTYYKEFIKKQSEQQKESLHYNSNISSFANTNISQIYDKYDSFLKMKKTLAASGTKSIDTLIVGAYGSDSLVITGTYFHNGPIIIVNDGKLRFRNANATIIGDIFVWGNNARLFIDSSYIYCPQQYFYQRSLTVAAKGKLFINNSTMDYSGLSHNLALADSALAIFNNITNIGFTTCGLWGAPSIKINKTNQAGEFICNMKSDLEFKNANTVLLWHHIPAGASLDFSFPAGAIVNTYRFSNSTPGVSGIGYSIKADTCTNIMWGLMPTNGSSVKISNSVMRAIGLWFEGADTVSVNGLVNNSNYTDFTANLTDRNLRLINTSLTTWSLYPMKKSFENVSGCILGEIGLQGRSRLEAQSIVVDGSGGYIFSTDTTTLIYGYSSAACAVRSDKNAIVFFAYSSLMNGVANSLGQSVMIIIQSTLQEDPVPLDRSCMWLETINGPSTGFVDTIVNIEGSAWIDKTFTSPLMDFNYYSLYYQEGGDSVWTSIVEKVHVEKRDEILAPWNTYGIAPGNYVIKLVLHDNSPDSNTIEALKTITLLPKILGVDEYISDENVIVSPNPASRIIDVTVPASVNIKLLNSQGQIMFSIDNCKLINKIDVSAFSGGIYFLRIGDRITKKIIIL